MVFGMSGYIEKYKKKYRYILKYKTEKIARETYPKTQDKSLCAFKHDPEPENHSVRG